MTKTTDLEEVVSKFVGKALVRAEFDENDDFVIEFNDNSLMVVEIDGAEAVYIARYEKVPSGKLN